MQSNTTEQQHLMAALSVQPALIVQCMGGWGCTSRTRCAHFHASPIAGIEPSERLCAKGCEEPEPLK